MSPHDSVDEADRTATCIQGTPVSKPSGKTSAHTYKAVLLKVVKQQAQRKD